MLYQVGVLVALLSCICAGVCLSSLLVLAICHTFDLAFVEFSINNELQELNTSIESSLPWLLRRTAALATATINSIRSAFPRVSFKSNPNYTKIIAQKDQEIAQLRQTIIYQAARIELLETRNAAVVKVTTPPADPLIAQQAAEIAGRDARISSLTDTTVRQADVEVQLCKKLADKMAKIEDQEVRIAIISGDMSYLEDQVKKLKGEKNEAFATARLEGIHAQVQEAQEAQAVAEEGRAKAQDRLVEYEELLENAAFDVKEMQLKVTESKKIDPYIYRQTVQQVHSLHAERDEARAARDTAIKESFEAKTVELETIKRMTALLKELKSAVHDKEIAESKFGELKCKLNKDVQTAEHKARTWEIKYSEKVNDVAKTQRASSHMEANLRNKLIRADIKGKSTVVSAQAKVLSLENQVELLQASNELLNEQLQRSKNPLRHARHAKQPTLEQSQAQASSGQSAEELQAYNQSLTIRLQEVEETAEKDKQVLLTSLQSKIDELHVAHAELQQRHIPSTIVPSENTGINLEDELKKQRIELEGACRKILDDKDAETHMRVDAVIQERKEMEQRLRNEMMQSENDLKELANKIWDEKRAEFDMQIEQASVIIINMRADLERIEEEKKTAIEKVETDYEYLLLDVDRLNEEVGNLKQAAKDRDAKSETAEAGKRPIDGDTAMTSEPTSTTSSESAKPASAFGQPSSLPPFGATSQQSVPFTFGANTKTVPATKPLHSRTAAGKKPANDLLSFDVAGNALDHHPSLFRAKAGNQPASSPFLLGAVAGNKAADNPFSFGAIATNKPANRPFTFGALGNKTSANHPPSCAAPLEEPKANEPPSFGSLTGGLQVDRSKPASAQPPAPTPAKPTETPPSPAQPVTLAEARPPAETRQGEKPLTPTTTSAPTQPSKSASPNSPATATSTPPSMPEKKPTPATATVTAAQAGGKAIALAAAAKLKADKAAALEAQRASDIREEFARNTPNKLADQLLEQLQGSNETLRKITNIIKTDKRMVRVEDIHGILCTSPIPNEKSFNNVDSTQWPALDAQLKDIQAVFDDLDALLEDYHHLRWDDLLLLLTKPRRHDPVDDAPVIAGGENCASPRAPADHLALPGLYPDGNGPATRRVIKPMPRIRRGPNKLVVTVVD